jgi:Na+/phosphate symporter
VSKKNPASVNEQIETLRSMARDLEFRVHYYLNKIRDQELAEQCRKRAQAVRWALRNLEDAEHAERE